MEYKRFVFVATVLITNLIINAVEVDFSDGGYRINKSERRGEIKYDRREARDAAEDIAKQQKKEMKANYEKRVKERPWERIVIYDGGIVSNDFINTTSNRLIITVLDWESAKKDNVKDNRKIAEKYRLNLMLLPGDKYCEMNDGKNGVRLAKYLQAHKCCEINNETLLGNKFKYHSFYPKRLAPFEKYTTHKMILKLENGEKEMSYIANSMDDDGDGVYNFEEVMGTKGFVTDPTKMDTDDDGIPDKIDKNPLIKCKSNDPKLMPQEWAESFSRGESEKIKLLLPVDGDPDEDGLSNEQEKFLKTDPLEKNSDKAIAFPLIQYVVPDENGKFISYIYLYFNCDFPVVLDIWSSADPDESYPYDASIFVQDCIPLDSKKSPFKKLINKRRLQSHFGYRIVADVQPKTVYSFKICNNFDKIVWNEVSFKAYSKEEYFKTDKQYFAHGEFSMTKARNESNWDYPDFWPQTLPNLLSPCPDLIFSNLYSVKFQSDNFPEKYKKWNRYKLFFYKMPESEPSLSHYHYNIDFDKLGPGQEVYCSYRPDSKSGFKDFNNVRTILWCLRYVDPEFNEAALQSEMRPAFREERIRKNNPFVFKGNTLIEITRELRDRGYRNEPLVKWE